MFVFFKCQANIEKFLHFRMFENGMEKQLAFWDPRIFPKKKLEALENMGKIINRQTFIVSSVTELLKYA